MLRSWHWTPLAGCAALACCILAPWVIPAAAQSTTTQAAATVPAREAQRKNTIPADAGSIATGKQVYTGNCAPCHGATGKGNGPVAYLQVTPPSDLTDAKHAQDSDGTLYWKLSNGHPPMPKFDFTLLPEESRWNVVNYLRTLITPPAIAPKPATVPAIAPATSQTAPKP